MFKRFLFVIVFIFCIPAIILAFFIIFLKIVLSPIIWIITGDSKEINNFIMSGTSHWLINLPYLILKRD